MPYFSNGQAFEGRPWSLAALTAAFWGFINFIVLFFKSLVNPNLSKDGPSYSSSYTRSGRPAERGRTIGRIRHGSSGPKAPPMGGGG